MCDYFKHDSQSLKSPGTNWHRLIHCISFCERRFLDFLVTRPDLLRMVMVLKPDLPRTVTRLVLVRPLLPLKSECVCTEL